MIGKYIKMLKFRESQEPPQAITPAELVYISRIRMILMSRAQIPEDFKHVGPDNSDEEDQFYKYRNDLIDIFKWTLEIPGSKEAVLDEISQYTTSLTQASTIEQVELPFYLLFHFAEKVNDISTLLKSDNKYSQLIAYMIRFPIPGHKIVLKMYLENIVRYAGFFDTNEHILLFPQALQYFLVNITSPDKEARKHTIYMLHRLAIKNCSCLVQHDLMQIH